MNLIYRFHTRLLLFKLSKKFYLFNTIDDWIVNKLFDDNVDQTFRLNKIGTRSYSKISNNICENLNPSSKSFNKLIVTGDIKKKKIIIIIK